MATTSRFVGLTSSVLLEYVYADQSAINEAGNEFRINTTSYPIWLLENEKTNEHQILNSDSSKSIVDGLPQGTSNVRDRSFVYLNSNTGALLDIDKVSIYNDYDSDMTNTASLPISFSTAKSPVYDTIKLHLVQGFNFEENQGFVLTVRARDKNGANFILANLAFNRTDTFETLNPTPFLFGGKSYDSYVEIRVLSLYNLIYDYWVAAPDGDSVVEKVTQDVGIQRSQPIQLSFSWISEKNRSDDQDYIKLVDTVEFDLPARDPFENISAYIAEAEENDYIEFYATHNGSIIENYLLDLNSSGGDYIILHDLVVSEYIYNPSGATYAWVQTDDLQLSQTDDFDLPNVYRPVIRSGAAVAFRINYTCRLYNRADNTQIWRTGSMISRSANKYGRKLKAINLGSNPVQSKIYNQQVVKNINIIRDQEEVFDAVKYITAFIDTNNVSMSTQTLNTLERKTSTTARENDENISSDQTNNRIYDNGLGRVMIQDGVSYLKFIFHQRVDGEYTLLDISGIGEMKLVFAKTNADEIVIDEFPNNFTSKTGGESVFRITSNQAKNILGLEDRTFKIFLENEKGERSFVYAGKFYSIDEYKDLQEDDRVTSLEKVVDDQTSLISSLRDLSDEQQATIDKLLEEKQSFVSTITSDEDLINSLKDTIRDLQKQIKRYGRQVDESTASVSRNLGKKPKPPKETKEDDPRNRSRKGNSFYEEEIEKNRRSIKKSSASSFGVNEE